MVSDLVGKRQYGLEANKRVELGHNILVASDQWGFFVEQRVIERQAEVLLPIPLADKLLNRFGEDAMESFSFDKGFYKRENKELLSRVWTKSTKQVISSGARNLLSIEIVGFEDFSLRSK